MNPQSNITNILRAAFSFEYPKSFRSNVTPYGENSEVITFEKNQGNGFQIFIMPFDEEGPLTEKRIRQELDITMQNPREITLDGITAFAFNGYEEALGGHLRSVVRAWGTALSNYYVRWVSKGDGRDSWDVEV